MSTLFVGRQQELGRLESALESAAAARPQVVVVAGDAGFGKTALLRRFGAGLSRPPLTIACDESESLVPLSAIQQLVTDASGRDPLVVGGDLLQKLGSRQQSGVTVLIVDDAHLMDPDSARALTFALRRLRVDRVLAVLAVRSDEAAPLAPGLARLGEDHGDRMLVGGLSAPEVAELAVAMRGLRLSPRAASRLRQHAAGSPLHLRSLLLELSEEQLTSTGGSLPAPPSFRRQVLSTLAAGSPESQRLARAAAVVGEPADADLLAALADVRDPLPGLEELQRAAIFELRQTGRRWQVTFQHQLIRVAVHDDIGPATLRTLHQRAAEVVGPPHDLDHRVLAAGGPDELLAAELEARARVSQSAGRLRLAADDLLTAHRLGGPDNQRPDRLLDAIDLLVRCGDLPTATGLSGAIEGRRDLQAIRVKAGIAILSGRFRQARELAEAAWQQVTAGSPHAEIAAMLAQLCVLDDDGRGAHMWAQLALRSGELSPAAESSARALAAIGLGISGSPGAGLALLDDLASDPAVVALERHDELRARGTLRMITDDLAGAAPDLLVVANAQHDLAGFRLSAMACFAESRFRAGDWDGSLATAEHGVSLAQDCEQLWLIANLHAVAAYVLAPRGQWSGASSHVEAARAAAALIGDRASPAYANNAAVHLAMCRRDPQAVLNACGPLIASPITSAAWQEGTFSWPVHRAEALVDLGLLEDAARAIAALDEHRVDVPVTCRQYALGRVRARLAAASGERSQAREAFEYAVSASPDWPDALEHARAHADFGRFLRRRGERKSAIEHLLCAREELSRLRANAFLAACDAELEAAGVRTARSDMTRKATLTSQEQTVARLVAAGMTNQQVARELILSLKTINFHLEHVYHKLGVHSRSQLAALYRTHERVD